MTAADRMVVRTRDGYKSMPRRAALGLIAAGRAKSAPYPAVERLRERLAAAVAVPPSVLAPTDEYVNHWTEGDPTGRSQAEARGLAEASRNAVIPAAVSPLLDDEPGASMNRTAAVELDPPLSEPRGNASRMVWAQYAESLGLIVPDEMTRNEIRDAAREAAKTNARLPQPAREGGRLETPEDEPAPESTGADDGPNPG